MPAFFSAASQPPEKVGRFCQSVTSLLLLIFQPSFFLALFILTQSVLGGTHVEKRAFEPDTGSCVRRERRALWLGHCPWLWFPRSDVLLSAKWGCCSPQGWRTRVHRLRSAWPRESGGLGVDRCRAAPAPQ